MSDGSRRREHAIAALLLLGLGVPLYMASYQGWGHPIIDLGRDLYLPGQLLSGRVLYRDLLYSYGPVGVGNRSCLFQTTAKNTSD